MRYLNALIVSTWLFMVPSIALAATESRRALPAASVASPAQAHQSQRRDASVVSESSKAEDKARYAEREAQSGEAQKYRGGDTIVIGASALAVILLVVLIVVLI